jgi:hypothetical protein
MIYQILKNNSNGSGTTFGIATFKLSTAAAGTSATVRELRFATAGTDAIESITVGGVTAPVISGGTTTVSGLNIAISSTGAVTPPTVIDSIASVPTVEKRSSRTVATVPATAVFRLNEATPNVVPPTTY